MIAVLDTNIFVAALLNPSAPAKIRERWWKGQFEVLVSPHILEEYSDVFWHIQSISTLEIILLMAEHS